MQSHTHKLKQTQALGDLYGSLSIVLVRANTRAILARSSVAGGRHTFVHVQVNAMDHLILCVFVIIICIMYINDLHVYLKQKLPLNIIVCSFSLNHS